MKFLSTTSSAPEEIQTALQRPSAKLPDVSAIIEDVRDNGDEALSRLSIRFDGVDPEKIQLRVPLEGIQDALRRIDLDLRQALEQAIANIEKFHRMTASMGSSEIVETQSGVRCWKEIRPIDSAGLYVPGGTAPLVSSVLMLGIPAQIASVDRIVLCTPPNTEGKVPDAILAACALVEIDEVYAVGGAQAIAAMAYGTKSIQKVSKIAGPGNAYVNAAKAAVRNDPKGADIDAIAGPSEVLIIADETANARFVASDLLAQAEHDRLSQVVLLTTSQRLMDEVGSEIAQQLQSLPRSEIAGAALERSCFILTSSIEEAIALSNGYAPEHLIINVQNYENVLPQVRNAGSVFLGPYSAETLGDYCSGPNHALPTLGFAKVIGGVSVSTFQKGMTVQEVTAEGLQQLARAACTLADAEGLEAHKRALLMRLLYLDELAPEKQ